MTNTDLLQFLKEHVNGENIEKYIQKIDVLGNENIVIVGNNHCQIPITKNYYQLDKTAIQSILTQLKAKPKHLNHIPLALPPKVIGRKNDLEKVDELLFKDNALVIVNGIGGIGKTVLSHYYWQERQYKYTHLLWLKGDGNLEDALLYDYNLHEGLGIAEEMKYHLEAIRQPQNQEAKKQAIAFLYKSLKNVTPKALMLIDNATDENHRTIKEWKTTFTNFHILVTSRIIFDDVATHSLGFLNKDEAKELFYLHYDKEKNDEIVENIVKIAGYHTLTIELLAKNAKHHRGLNLERLQNELQKHIVYQEKIVSITSNYTQDKIETQATIDKILEYCFDLSGVEKDVLVIYFLAQFSILPAQYLPHKEICQLFNVNENNEQGFYQVIDILINKGWIQEDNDAYFCHSIIQEIVRKKTEINTDWEKCKLMVININCLIDIEYKNNQMYKAIWLSYVENILLQIKIENHDIAILHNSLGILYDRTGDYVRALEYYNKAIEMHYKNQPKDYAQIAITLHNIGFIYKELGLYKEAIGICMQTQSIYEEFIESEEQDSDLLGSLFDNMGLIYREIFDIDNAAKYFQKALEIRLKLLDPNNYKIANSFTHIGLSYHDQKEFVKALEYYEKGLKIRKACSPINTIDIANSFHNIGYTYNEMGNYPLAIQYYEDAVKILKEELPKTAINLAELYSNISVSSNYMGYHYKSEFYIKEAIKIREEVFPDKKHPDLATSYYNLGSYYNSMERYLEAIEYLEKSIKIQDGFLGQHRIMLAHSYNNIAYTYSQLKLWGKSLSYCKKQIEILYETNSFEFFSRAFSWMGKILYDAIKADGYNKYQIEKSWFDLEYSKYSQ